MLEEVKRGSRRSRVDATRQRLHSTLHDGWSTNVSKPSIEVLGHLECFHPEQVKDGAYWSRNDLIFRDRDGCFNFRNALASICRIRSRVTLNCCPTSSSV